MPESLRVVVVTGLSGSGKSTAIHVLEDLGYYCIDNLPAPLIPQFVDLCRGLGEGVRRVALGIDLRERTFFNELPGVLRRLREGGDDVEILFLDASDEILRRRFSETRRPHPLADGGAPQDGIDRERDRLRDVRDQANQVVDTSDLSVHELRATVEGDYGESAEGAFTVFVVSFGFKYGLASSADTVFDVRFLPNPYFVPELRRYSGLDAPIVDFLAKQSEAGEFFERCESMLEFLLPRYQREGKRYFTVAFGCTGGRHRSVAMAERTGHALRSAGWDANIRHRDVERAG